MSASAQFPGTSSFIDLHAHTNESDGSLSPDELVALAVESDLAALAITDHDTFTGYEKAIKPARERGLDLVCGIELNTRMRREDTGQRRAVHILAYFLSGDPGNSFRSWLENERVERRDRNSRLAEKLKADGIDITLEEVEARGRSLAGRPHFARILVEKGYVKDAQEAFSKYLGESAPSFVPRQSKSAVEVIQRIRSAGGIPVVAHPIRLELPRREERELLVEYKEAGLLGLEIYHSEHPPDMQAYYRQLAEELELVPTGGSDFHGLIKPSIRLGTGFEGNVRVPADFIQALRRL